MRGFPGKRRRRASSGRLGALLPGETLPLDEPRLTAFEALNLLFWRAPYDSTEHRIAFPRRRTAQSAARGFPMGFFRWMSRA